MRRVAAGIAVVLAWGGALVAQETKPVPKDSVRLSIPGCAKGYVFTAGRRTQDEAGSTAVPDGTHFRLNGSKKLMQEIKAHEGSMIEITGLTKKGQWTQGGVAIGGGVRVGPGSGPGGNPMATSMASQLYIDVEGWRPIVGDCPSR